MFIVKKKNVKYSAKIGKTFFLFFSKFLRISKSIGKKNKFLKIPLIFSEQTVEYKTRLFKQLVKICYFQDLQNV